MELVSRIELIAVTIAVSVVMIVSTATMNAEALLKLSSKVSDAGEMKIQRGFVINHDADREKKDPAYRLSF